MELRVEPSQGYNVAFVEGSLGIGDETAFIERLAPLVAERQAKLAIVLSGVRSIDSSGLGALIGLVTRARMREGRVILVGPTRLVRGVLEVTQLDGWFEVCSDLQEAARCFA